ncbi:MAG: formate/nitrite transporter family protein [Pseudolabrys sp.]
MEAKKRLNALHNAVHTGEHVDPDHITLATWAEHWLKLGAPGQRRQEVGARSLERYEQILRTHVLPALGQYRLQQLQSTDIDKLYLGLEGKIAPRTARSVHVIALVTWLIAVGGFTHIVAGSMEAYLLVLAGDWAWWQMLSQFLLPVLIGNMIGGTALFALLSYAQVMEEI